ncbi:MAG TPA: CBS domain-containing protein, partial [Bacteroidetes bacterium]|nr:CBS domain-containing protein [Bacteroidota bacterium]
MGEHNVSLLDDKEKKAKFLKALLDDVQALEFMLKNDWFESDVQRIGAEQEMVLVDKQYFKPSLIGPEVIDNLQNKYKWIETELAKFNIETNLNPRVFEKKAFSEMEKEISEYLKITQKELDKYNSQIVLTGVLPTIRKFDLELKNLTPKERYKALMEAINKQLLGQSYELKILGIDELIVKHDSPLIEACNTSFQVHLQINPNEFVKMYNISQVLAAPTMAIAANSPLVFGKRLWHETRIALFQQALDTRSSHEHLRERSPRVRFGNDWVNDSILDIYKDDITRFRVLLSTDISENSLEKIDKNEIPKLMALNVHNSTVYRWNRACYGISDTGKPHLRIENRVLPAGPTVVDEMANAAFWLGAMTGMAAEIEDIRDHISFADARDNFGKAAKFGIDTKLTWFNDEKIGPNRLILEKLLPLAEKGLRLKNVNEKDIKKYLGVIEKRAQKHMNGARWQLRAFTKLKEKGTDDQALSILTAAMIENQKDNIPVSEWKLPKYHELTKYKPSKLLVSEFMQTDLLTVQEDDIIEFVADLMVWKKNNFALVEDDKGNLVGLVDIKSITEHLIKNKNLKKDGQFLLVSDIMDENP